MKDKHDKEEEYIFGRNVILAFLEQSSQSAANESIAQLDKIFLASGLQFDRRIEKIKQLARTLSIPIVSCDKQQLDKFTDAQSRHQGIVARLSQAKTLSLQEFLQSLAHLKNDEGKLPNILLAIADGIQDPHNLGALIRVAQAAGAKGLITSHRRSAGTTGTVAKASAGAIAYLPIIKVTNIVNTLNELKDFGFWIAGLDAGGKESLFSQDLKMPLAVVVGGEGKGIGKLVGENCDLLVRIPMASNTESLNASVAAGIVFFEYVRQNLCQNLRKE